MDREWTGEQQARFERLKKAILQTFLDNAANWSDFADFAVYPEWAQNVAAQAAETVIELGH